MYLLFSLFAMLFAIFMIIVVLLQKSKKEGGLDPMAMGTTQLIGISNTTDLLEKITWGLSFSIALFAIISTILLKKNLTKNIYIESPNVKAAQKKALITRKKNSNLNKNQNTNNDLQAKK